MTSPCEAGRARATLSQRVHESMNLPSGDRLLVYGATGYTGGLLAALAKERGLAPIVAGRSRERVEALATRLGVEARVAAVDDPAALAEMLRGVACRAAGAGRRAQ